ncbi:hypothetical protein ACFL08_00775 [Patescibacteria group bacterium]
MHVLVEGKKLENKKVNGKNVRTFQFFIGVAGIKIGSLFLDLPFGIGSKNDEFSFVNLETFDLLGVFKVLKIAESLDEISSETVRLCIETVESDYNISKMEVLSIEGFGGNMMKCSAVCAGARCHEPSLEQVRKLVVEMKIQQTRRQIMSNEIFKKVIEIGVKIACRKDPLLAMEIYTKACDVDTTCLPREKTVDKLAMECINFIAKKYIIKKKEGDGKLRPATLGGKVGTKNTPPRPGWLRFKSDGDSISLG